MAEIVVMPKVGLTAREALLREWLVDVGHEVKVGDPLCEIETDKIVNEMESPVSGVLLKRIDTDLVVPVGEPIAVIGAAAEDVEGLELFAGIVAGETVEEGQDVATAIRPSGPRKEETAVRTPVSPIARKLAEELGVDLSRVVGTGPGGRVTRRDVEDAPPSPAATSATLRREVPSKLRRAIASAMTASAAVPQFSLERDVDVTELMDALKERSADFQPISIADAIGVASARAIRRHPEFLRSWDDGAVVMSDDVALGLAVAVDDGLIVPVIHGADGLTIEEFSERRRRLQDRIQQWRLSTSESTGAVFTISNLGPLGVDRFRALVNPPESGILALGRIRQVHGRSIVALTLSADHRVVDGVVGARLLGEIVRFLEGEDGLRELLSVPARDG